MAHGRGFTRQHREEREHGRGGAESSFFSVSVKRRTERVPPLPCPAAPCCCDINGTNRCYPLARRTGPAGIGIACLLQIFESQREHQHTAKIGAKKQKKPRFEAHTQLLRPTERRWRLCSCRFPSTCGHTSGQSRCTSTSCSPTSPCRASQTFSRMPSPLHPLSPSVGTTSTALPRAVSSLSGCPPRPSPVPPQMATNTSTRRMSFTSTLATIK
jgi:hypothetical protein